MIYNWHKIINCFGSQKNHHLLDKSSLWKRVEGDSKGKLEAIIRNIFPSNGDTKICVKRWVCWDSGLSVSWSFITLAWIGGRGGHTSTSNTSNTHKSGVFFIPIILKKKKFTWGWSWAVKTLFKKHFSAFNTFRKWTTSDESYTEDKDWYSIQSTNVIWKMKNDIQSKLIDGLTGQVSPSFPSK